MIRSGWSAASSMSVGTAVRLYTTPHQHKYLLGKLSDPKRTLRSPYGLHALEEIQLILRHRLLQVRSPGVLNHVELLVEAPAEYMLSRNQEKQLNGFVSSLMAKELVQTVSFYTTVIGMRRREALRAFLREYGIDDEDWSFEAVQICYWRTCRRIAKRNRAARALPGISPP